jgi:riboflavin kinase/FMN adenylyltransferase
MPSLSSTPEKIRLLQSHGIDRVYVLKFDTALANLSAEEFLTEILLNRLRSVRLVVGYNHSFGKDRQGNSEFLERIKSKYGFDVKVVGPYHVNGDSVSSSKIRKSLDAGDVERAARFLGRPYDLCGTVIPGRGVGKELHFPTANLQLVYPERLIPKVGVYAVAVRLDHKTFPGMLNIGMRPTFGTGDVTIEVHLIDFDDDLYDEIITLLFLKHLRDEEKFKSPEALIRQLEKDREESLNIFGKSGL